MFSTFGLPCKITSLKKHNLEPEPTNLMTLIRIDSLVAQESQDRASNDLQHKVIVLCQANTFLWRIWDMVLLKWQEMVISNQNKSTMQNLIAHSFLVVVLLNTLCALRNNQKYTKSFDSRGCSFYSAFHHSKKQQTTSEKVRLKEVRLRGKEHPNKEAQRKQPLKDPILFVDIYFQDIYSKTCIVHRGSKRQIKLHITSLLFDYVVGRKYRFPDHHFSSVHYFI